MMKLSRLNVDSGSTPALSVLPANQPEELLIKLGLMDSSVPEKPASAVTKSNATGSANRLLFSNNAQNALSLSSKETKPGWKKKVNSLMKRLTSESNPTSRSLAVPAARPDDVLIKLGLMDSSVHQQTIPALKKLDIVDKSISKDDDKSAFHSPSNGKVSQKSETEKTQPHDEETDDVKSPKIITDAFQKQKPLLLYTFASATPTNQKNLIKQDEQKDAVFCNVSSTRISPKISHAF